MYWKNKCEFGFCVKGPTTGRKGNFHRADLQV